VGNHQHGNVDDRDHVSVALESLSEAFRDVGDTLARVAAQSHPEAAWKTIVKAYLGQEFCDHPERGCPLPALAPRIDTRRPEDEEADPSPARELQGSNASLYAGPATADKERAFFAIFSTMAGAIEIARMLPEPAMREKVLSAAKDFLLSSF